MSEWKNWAPKNWRDFVVWLLAAGVLSAGIFFGCLPADTPIPAPPGPVFEPPDPGVMGWISDPEAVKVVQEKLEFKVFGDTPAGKADEELPQAVYLWESYQKLFARPPPSKNQGSVGSCVGFGTAAAVERTLATQIVQARGDAEEFRALSPEYIYGISRVQIGGGRIGGDGSVGSWAAKGVLDYGVVAQEPVAGFDLSRYSETLCRTWGRKPGPPVAVQEQGKKNPVQDMTFCKSWANVKRALASGYALSVCSDVGFEMPRDANGVKRPRGSWAHCMTIDGYHVEGRNEYAHIENSWGARPNEGPVGWGNPPDSGFWVEASVIDSICRNRNNEVIAFSAVKGWPSRKLNWFVRAGPDPAPGLRPQGDFHERELQFASLP